MSFTSENYFLFLLLASNAALVAISCFALFRFERRWRRIEDIWNSAADTALSVSADEDVIAQLEASQKQQVSQRHEATQRLEASQRLERHIGELQRAVKVMGTRGPEKAPALARAVPIENAVRMARLGASIEDLTRNCGLNLGEARLLQKMHGKADIAAAPG